MKINVYSVSADYVTFNIFKCLGFRQEAETNKHVQLTYKPAGQITLFHGLYVDAVLQANGSIVSHL